MAIERIADVTLRDKIRYGNNPYTAIVGATIRVMTNNSPNGATRGITGLGGGLLLHNTQQEFIGFLSDNFDLDTELSNNAMACVANALRCNSTKDADPNCVYVAIVGVADIPQTKKQKDNFDALCVDLGLVDSDDYVVVGMETKYETLCKLYESIQTTAVTLLMKVAASDIATTTINRTDKSFATPSKENVAIGTAKVRPAKVEKPPFTEGTVDDKGLLVRLDGETDAKYKDRVAKYDAWVIA